MSEYVKQINDTLVEMSEEEINKRKADEKEWADNSFNRSISSLREKRDNLLKETDWWASSDLIITDEQKKYRQDLRDITNGLTTVEEVNAVEFPTKPS
tara:strand:- start:47 stop:340 length:294 start_codon:yes stop_codon:yes gene_type:complete